jgi:hypothetical protein
MQKEGIAPSLMVYNTFIETYAKRGEIESKQLKISTCTFTIADLMVNPPASLSSATYSFKCGDYVINYVSLSN